MSSKSSPTVPLLLAAIAAMAVAYGIHRLGQDARVPNAGQSSEQPARPKWAAAAQGRVEPKSGEIRLSALAPGRIEEVLVQVNDRVVAGDLLVRVDDQEAMARMIAADAEAGVRKRERDTETGTVRLAQDRRNAEDKLNGTERAITTARLALDRLLIARHVSPPSVPADQIAAARAALEEAVRRLPGERETLKQAQLAAGVPLPTRLESSLTASRAELSVAEAALERTRLRAPLDGVVLQVTARVGELASPSPEQTLLVVGDLSQLRVRAEVEERDVSKITVGQLVQLKADAFPDREFTGKVASVAQAMRPPRLGQRGPRRPTDLDTLEVLIDVDAGSPLLPGMRTDVFFRPEGPRAETSPTRAAVLPADAAVRADAQPSAATAPATGADGAKVLPPLAEERRTGN